MSISEAIADIKSNILQAQKRSKYAAENVLLLAVSKTKPLEAIREAYQCGQCDFGENRVQELVEKQQALPNARWHLVGHLQTNKVKQLIGKTLLIHSLDSLSLAQEINKRSSNSGLVTDCLVQVNIAEEDSKSGLAIGEVSGFLDQMAEFPAVRCCGIMTIGPMTEDERYIRQVFAKAREIFISQKERELPHTDFRWLSMGMSGDYQIAVEEGSNIIRVGSSIFGARNYF